MRSIIKVTKKIGIGILSIVLVVLSIVLGWHRMDCMIHRNELEQLGKSVQVNHLELKTKVIGEGKKTIVLLSGMGTPEPIIDFSPLAERLAKQYKVVIIEYPGYGLSDDTDTVWTNEYVAEIIRGTLKQLEIKPPYILMPHSVSGIYCMKYVEQYPEEVEAVIGLEASVPMQLFYADEDDNLEISDELYKLVKILDASGLTRLLQKIDGEQSLLSGMKAGGHYTKKQLEVVDEVLAQHSISKTQLSEFRNLHQNELELKNFQYPETLPVLYLLSDKSADRYDQFQKKCGSSASWYGLHSDTFSNHKIQKIKILSGEHYLQWTAVDEIAEQTQNFLQNIQ